MAAVETVIFDLGGVLVDWNPRYLYRKIFSKEAEMNAFLENVCTSDWNEQQDAGRPLAVATQLLLDQYPDYTSEIQAFYGRWEEMLGGVIKGTEAILRQLHQQASHRIYALTNWSAETFPVAQARYDFLQLFEGILVSGEEMMKKPDPRIYHLIFERYAIDPATALFIDDNQKNVEAARKVGLDAIRFTSPEELRTVLLQKEVLHS